MKKLLGILIILGSLVFAIPTLAQTNGLNLLNSQLAQTLDVLLKQIAILEIQVQSLEAESEGVMPFPTQINNQVQIESVDGIPVPIQQSRPEPGFYSGILSQPKIVSQPSSQAFTPIYPGVTDSDVLRLQNELDDLGFWDSGVSKAPIYGPATKRAVGKFQESYLGLSPGDSGYGNLGPRTTGVFNDILNSNSQGEGFPPPVSADDEDEEDDKDYEIACPGRKECGQSWNIRGSTQIKDTPMYPSESEAKESALENCKEKLEEVEKEVEECKPAVRLNCLKNECPEKNMVCTPVDGESKEAGTCELVKCEHIICLEGKPATHCEYGFTNGVRNTKGDCFSDSTSKCSSTFDRWVCWAEAQAPYQEILCKKAALVF